VNGRVHPVLLCHEESNSTEKVVDRAILAYVHALYRTVQYRYQSNKPPLNEQGPPHQNALSCPTQEVAFYDACTAAFDLSAKADERRE